MKLYREVKTSERSPDREQFHITQHQQGDIMYLCWIPEHEVWEDADEYQFGSQEITSWLEPIEITEGDIEEMIINSLAIMPNGEHRLIPEDYVKLPAQWILSKLKGE